MVFGKVILFTIVPNKMKASLKTHLLTFLFYINIGCVVVVLLGNLATLLDPSIFWPLAVLGILFPILIIISSIFILFWLLVTPKRGLLSFIALLISLPNLRTTFAVNSPLPFKQIKQPGSIRLVTWNVALMNYTETDTVKAIKNNALIFSKLKETDADILCLQEFFTAVIPGNHYNLMDSIARTMNYPYLYFARDNPKFNEQFFMGTIIFSRYKIVDTFKINFSKPFIGSLIKTGIVINDDTIDVFTTRLQSVNFHRREYHDLNAIKSGKDGSFDKSKNIINKLRNAYAQRKEQVVLVKKSLNESKRPLLFTGDINDVPVSFTYSFLSKGMNDCWVNKGYGLGKTFQYLSPTLRIDHIFYSDKFNARQVKRILSGEETDHYGIIADFSLIKKEQ